MNHEQTQKYQLISLIILVNLAITVALYYAKPVLMPFVFAIFYYSASVPLMNFLELRLRLPRFASLATTFLIVGSISFLCIGQLSYFLASLIGKVESYHNMFIELIGKTGKYLETHQIYLDQTFILNSLKDLPIVSYVKVFSGGAISFLGNTLLILIIYCFLLTGRDPAGNEDKNSLVREIESKISSYVINKILLSFLTGIIIASILFFYKLQLATLFGVLCVVLNFIPSIGSIIATVLPMPVIILQYGIGPEFFTIIGLCSVAQIIIGNIIDPKIVGKDLDLHPIAILLSLVFWGMIWGVPGAFLATPITAVIKIIFSKIQPTKRLSELLAGRF